MLFRSLSASGLDRVHRCILGNEEFPSLARTETATGCEPLRGHDLCAVRVETSVGYPSVGLVGDALGCAISTNEHQTSATMRLPGENVGKDTDTNETGLGHGCTLLYIHGCALLCIQVRIQYKWRLDLAKTHPLNEEVTERTVISALAE